MQVLQLPYGFLIKNLMINLFKVNHSQCLGTELSYLQSKRTWDTGYCTKWDWSVSFAAKGTLTVFINYPKAIIEIILVCKQLSIVYITVVCGDYGIDITVLALMFHLVYFIFVFVVWLKKSLSCTIWHAHHFSVMSFYCQYCNGNRYNSI